MVSSVIEIRGLNVFYKASRGLVKALRNVNLDVFERESLAVIGESGSGKTTLLYTIMRLLPSNARVESGSVYFVEGGQKVDLLSLNDVEIRKFRWRKISLVTQAAMNSFNPVMRVKDHFLETARAHLNSIDEGEVLSEAKRLLKMVLLEPDRVLNSYPHQLSGGMKQRTLIALALLLKPKVLLADEPTSALDVVSQKVILNVLTNVKEETGSTIVVVTHDLGVAAEIADRVTVMYAGKVVEIGSVEEVFYDPLHPYTKALIKAVPRIKGVLDVKYLAGEPPDLINPPPGCSFHPRCPYATDVCKTVEPEPHSVGGRIVACHLVTGKIGGGAG